MLNRFKQFYNIVNDYGKRKNFSCELEENKDKLLTDYKQWISDISNDIKAMNARDLLEYKRSVPLAHDGHKEMCESLSNKKGNCIAIIIGSAIAIFIGLVQMISAEQASTALIVAIVVIASAIAAFVIYYQKGLVPKYNNHFSKFLYYSAILSILNTMENEDTINNNATVVNSSTTKEPTKNKYKKKRKGIRK